MPRAICRDAGYWRQSAAIATLPGRAGGESLGLARVKCNVIFMTHHHHAGAAHPSPALSRHHYCGFPHQAPGARRRLDRAHRGRGAWASRSPRPRSPAGAPRSWPAGYDRHPAVHHLDGVVEARLVHGRSSARTAPASRRCSRRSSACSSRSPAAIVSAAVCRARHRLPAASGRDGPLVSDQCLTTSWRWGFGAAKAPSAGVDRKDHLAIEAALAVGLTGFEQRSIGTLGGQMQRMLFARLLVPRLSRDVLDERFVPSMRDRPWSHLVRHWHSERHRACGHARHRSRQGELSPNPSLAREPVAWGATREVLTPDNLNRARHVRGFDETAEPARRRGGASRLV